MKTTVLMLAPKTLVIWLICRVETAGIKDGEGEMEAKKPRQHVAVVMYSETHPLRVLY